MEDGGGGSGNASKPPARPTSTLLFRVFNPELYVGYNRWIAGVGSLLCGMAVVNVGLMKYERERELKREREENDRIPWSSEARDDEARIEDLKSTDATPVNPRKDLYMMFTCGVCETRAAKGFSRQAYENGVVIVRCPGCQSQHLVADHHGWFGDKGTIEDFLRERGEGVARGTADLPGVESEEGTLEIDPEQLEAWMEKSGLAPPR